MGRAVIVRLGCWRHPRLNALEEHKVFAGLCRMVVFILSLSYKFHQRPMVCALTSKPCQRVFYGLAISFVGEQPLYETSSLVLLDCR
jgi:hypothetical protein